MTDLYFNGRSWRRLGLNEQDVKFLERLSTALKTLESSSATDSTTVTTLNTTLTALQSTVDDIEDDVGTLEAAQDEVTSQPQTDIGWLESEIKRLQTRVYDLENP